MFTPDQKLLDLLQHRYEVIDGVVVVRNAYVNSPLVGERAGSISGSGYLHVRCLGKTLLVHHIAYLLHHKVWPNGRVDHKNGNRLDNSKENLRLASATMNNRNAKKPKNNSSGHTGITLFRPLRGVYWRASVLKMGRRIAKTFPYNDEGLTAAIAWRDNQLLEIGGYSPRHGT